MKTTHVKLQRGLLSALPAFGLVFLGFASSATAHPDDDPHARDHQVAKVGTWVRVGVGNRWTYRDGDGRHSDRYAYDLNRNGRLEHNEIDYRHYDRDRNGRLDPRERREYWEHMVQMGYFGDLSSREVDMLSHLAYRFDRNDDGRIDGRERHDFDRMIFSLRRFERIDLNSDNMVSRREARRSPALTRRFHGLDRNGDGYVSRQEVRDDILRAMRRGDRFWYDTMPDDRYGYGPRSRP